MQSTIIITGGHLTPAIAVIEEIQKRKLPWRILFIGRKNALEGMQIVSFEYQEITSRGIPFFSLTTGRVSRILTPWAIWSLMKIPIGFFQALYYVLRHRPRLVLSFGGYVAFPVALAAWLCRIPVVTHEQTHFMGLSNRLIEKMASKVLLSFPCPPSTKRVYTGLPIRSILFHPPKKPSFMVPDKKPVLYITGGSTGAVTLNDGLFPMIETLTRDWIIIHQTGTPSYQKALVCSAKLPKPVKDRYMVSAYFSASDVAWILHQATIVIGRSGANTVGELAALGKVSILVPLPWSGANEQQENARWLESQGSATIIPQSKDTGKQILAAIDRVRQHGKAYRDAAKMLQQSVPKAASSSVVDILQNLIAS